MFYSFHELSPEAQSYAVEIMSRKHEREQIMKQTDVPLAGRKLLAAMEEIRAIEFIQKNFPLKFHEDGNLYTPQHIPPCSTH